MSKSKPSSPKPAAPPVVPEWMRAPVYIDEIEGADGDIENRPFVPRFKGDQPSGPPVPRPSDPDSGWLEDGDDSGEGEDE
jgi:hypothetical protein